MTGLRVLVGFMMLTFIGVFIYILIVAEPRDTPVAVHLVLLWIMVANAAYAYTLMLGGSPYVLFISMILGFLPFVFFVPHEVFLEKTWWYLLWLSIQGTLVVAFRNQLILR